MRRGARRKVTAGRGSTSASTELDPARRGTIPKDGVGGERSCGRVWTRDSPHRRFKVAGRK